MSDLLSENEIVELTGKTKHSAQARELAKLGIRCRPRSNGTLIVAREHRDAVLGLRKTVRHIEQAGPNFAALD